jgi:aminoglycoside phosphotransferase (APT) family kinase protein
VSRPADTTFPGLDTALDVEAVLELLRAALPECRGGLLPLKNTILDVRYRPGGPCWILYRVKFRDARGRSRRQLISGRLLRAGERPDTVPGDLLERYRARDHVLSTPVLVLPDVPMQVFAYPVDASLPGLFDATDPSMLKRHLNRMWARRNVTVRKVVQRPLGYTPHARAAFLYEVLGECKDTGVPELRRLIGKMHAKKKAARLFADAWALWRAADGRVSMAPPVGYVPAVGLTLQEQVPGQRLGGLVTAPGFVKWVRQTAGLLATLHGLDVPLSSRRKPAEEVRGVHRWAGVLTAIRPDLTGRVERLRDRLAAEIEARAELAGPIHADFHHTNVLVDGERVTIIDLDEMAFGDPMVDVGRFLASLRVPARRAFGDLRALQEAGDAFLETYLTRAGGDEKRARLFEAASLLIAAGSSFRIQRPNWEEEVSLLVEEAERVFRLAGNGAAPAAVSAAARTSRSVADPARWSQDGVYMQALLDPHLRAAYGTQVTSCRVRRLGNGRIRFDLRGWLGEQRWSASLQGIPWPERRGRARVQRLELVRSALDGSGEAPLLPRPIAYLKPLSLLVCEIPAGTRFSSLIGSGDAAAVAESLARALAVLHGTGIELDERRTLERVLETLGEDVERLSVAAPDLAARAAGLLEEIGRRLGAARPRQAPIMRTLHPGHILWSGGRVAIEKVDEISQSHPYLDVGDFLARLTLAGIRHDVLAEVSETADRFRAAYRAAGPVAEGGMPAFEAWGLLRMACKQVEREANRPAAERLLACVEERLSS